MYILPIQIIINFLPNNNGLDFGFNPNNCHAGNCNAIIWLARRNL